VRRLLFILAALLAGTIAFFVTLLAPVDRGHSYQVSFEVLPGAGLQEISETLYRQGLIRRPRAFMALAVLRRQAGSLQAGPYLANSGEWAWTILDRLVSGAVEDTSVTVPEGLWVAEVAELVGPLVEGGVDSFLAAAADSVFLHELGIDAVSAEGYLFPDTYRFVPGARARAMVRLMVAQFFERWGRSLEDRARERGMSLHDTVTLASIVEAEAQVSRERPLIAAVYLNRLKRGLPLQSDPTVIYGMGERRARMLYRDLEHASPYNTYLNPGLPPGPICNPGFDSLRATLWPDPESKDLFFVARGDGTHLFAPDFEGHRRNRQIVRRLQTEEIGP
jgi:UPF0755 protein